VSGLRGRFWRGDGGRMDKNWGKNTFPWDAICVCETGYSSAHGKKSIIMDIVRFILCKKKGKNILFGKEEKTVFFFFNSKKTNKIDACCNSLAAPIC